MRCRLVLTATCRYAAENKLTPTTVTAATFGRLANIPLDAQVRRLRQCLIS